MAGTGAYTIPALRRRFGPYIHTNRQTYIHTSIAVLTSLEPLSVSVSANMRCHEAKKRFARPARLFRTARNLHLGAGPKADCRKHRLIRRSPGRRASRLGVDFVEWSGPNDWTSDHLRPKHRTAGGSRCPSLQLLRHMCAANGLSPSCVKNKCNRRHFLLPSPARTITVPG